MSRVLNLIWGIREAKYFSAKDWTGFRVRGLICPSGSHIAVLPRRHCEERSDEAIHSFFPRRGGLLRCARNDGEGRVRRTALRTGGVALPHRHCEEQRDEAIHSFLSWKRWIASRSLSSGARSRDTLAQPILPIEIKLSLLRQ